MYIIILISFLCFIADGNPYCEISPKHNLCIYKDGVMDPACGGAQYTPITDEQKMEIVNLHNEFRRKVASGATSQPNAANMREIVSHTVISF